MKISPRRHGRRSSRRGGFTLVEMMVSTTLLGIGLLGVAMMQLNALKQAGQGRNTTDAAAVARTYIEQIQRLPWSVLDTAQAAGSWTNPSWEGVSSSVTVKLDEPGKSSSSSVKTYNVQWKATDVAGSTCLREVEVSVSWDEEGYSSTRTVVLSTRRYNWGGSSC